MNVIAKPCAVINRRILCSAIALALVPISGATLAQQDQVEEVVVTGTFIRRTEGFRSASSVIQLTADDIAAAGTPNVGDIIYNLSSTNGSHIVRNNSISSGGVTTSHETGINLRGLGENATLNLLDGKRVIDNNVNTMLPMIAMQRLDIVTDGAAALYGSAAVAGVVNFVPMKSYDGLKLEQMSQMDSRSDYEDYTFSALYGTEWNGLNIVLAGEYRTNDALGYRDRPDYLRAAYGSSSFGNPGKFTVPTRDANGVLTGNTVSLADPTCSPTREDVGGFKNNPLGWYLNGTCYLDYGEHYDLHDAQDTGNFYGSLQYDVSPDLSVEAQYNFYKRRHHYRSSAAPAGLVTSLPTVRGELPGNPFRAVDANGNPLFAQDANGDGVPDRDAGGVVILDPAGIPFNEDVRLQTWRIWGKHGTLPSRFNDDGSVPRQNIYWSNRVSFGADFTVPFLDGWRGNADYTWGNYVDNAELFDNSLSAITQGLACDVANDLDACYTPFANPTDPINGGYNTQAVADSIALFGRQRNEQVLQTFDLVFSGDLPLGGFELPGGTIGAAVGYQRRDESYDLQPAYFELSDDAFSGVPQVPRNGNRQVDSVFMELSVPVLENLELQLAVRNEDYSSGQSSTDPKYGIVYSPTNFLTLRATKGTSFVAPTIEQLYRPLDCGGGTVVDEFKNFGSTLQQCSGGNPDLTPEVADTLSAGFTLNITDEMRLDVTWSETDFTDRIVRVTGQDLVGLDFFNFERAIRDVPAGEYPTTQELAAWIADPRSDKRIFRNANLDIESVRTTDTNATSFYVSAYDAAFTYDFGFRDLGDVRLNLNATYYDEYTYQASSLTSVVNAIGSENADTSLVPPIPRWKAGLMVGWRNGNHSANIAANYLHEVNANARTQALVARWAAGGVANLLYNGPVTELESRTIVDAAYNYSGLEVLGGDLLLTIGSRNLFDYQPQLLPAGFGFSGHWGDPIGRMLYARISLQL